MSNVIKPLPQEPVSNSFVWREWFYNLGQTIGGVATIAWTNLDFTSSNITDIENRAHNNLQGLQGGNTSATEYYHLSASEYANVQAISTGGISVTITTAKLTLAGTNGSMTFTNGILTAQTQAT